jgi:hypothetical protein
MQELILRYLGYFLIWLALAFVVGSFVGHMIRRMNP